MAYPDNKPSGNYKLRDYDFATLDDKKIPMDEYLFKNGYKNAEESEVESVPDAHEQNWLFDILHRNLKYTLETAEENKNLLATKVATPTSIGQVKVGYGLEVTTGGVLSVTKGIAEDANIISYDLPVGSYMLWAGNQPPEYFIEPAGQTLLRSSYPELWQFAQDNGLVGKLFGEGDGQTTFTVTDIRGQFISIANSNENVGKHTEAGLPNITGDSGIGFRVPYDQSGEVGKGALKSKRTGGGSWKGGTEGTFSIYLDASQSSPIYGKSNTVMPANWGLKIILKALPTPPSNAVPTGTILDYTGKSAPDGYIIANGAELSRKTFSRLFQWANANGLVKPQSQIPNTAHAFFGNGDGSTTFTIPDLRGCTKQGASLASNRGNNNLGDYTPSGRTLISKYINGTSWCNIYSDGWCEQGGTCSSGATVTLKEPYKDTNYTVYTGIHASFGGDGDASFDPFVYTPSKTGNGWRFASAERNAFGRYAITWRACGYTEVPGASEYNKDFKGAVYVTPILKY